MSTNIGAIDQFIRALAGFTLIAYVGRSGIIALESVPLLLIAVYLYVTAILQYCPLYQSAGISTFGNLHGSS